MSGAVEQQPGGTSVSEDVSYEAAVAELETIVAALQRDDVSVDDLASKVARGAALVEHCRGRLRAAEVAVEEVVAALRAAEAGGEAGEG